MSALKDVTLTMEVVLSNKNRGVASHYNFFMHVKWTCKTCFHWLTVFPQH